MAKRKRKLNVEKMLKEGRRQDSGSSYKPWIRIQDVPSLGRATKLKGIKTCKRHKFLSDLERKFFYILEYSDTAIDIRAQFLLLSLEETILIAKELGIEHPEILDTQEFVVMTTNFLIRLNSNKMKIEVSRTLKYKNVLLEKRVLEKYEIERMYQKNRGVDWIIVIENDIDKDIVNNISYVLGYSEITDLDCLVNIGKHELKNLI